MTYHVARFVYAEALATFLPAQEAQAEALRAFQEGLGRNRAWLLAHATELMLPEEQRLMEAWLLRRQAGEPWDYILGWSHFRGRRFEVGPAVLIPRPETEMLVEAALEMGKRLGVDRAVDVGTGSGIVAISLALETPWTLIATDYSASALAVARRNAARLGAPVSFVEGDLLGSVPDPLGLVVANLPYIDPADQASLQRELAWEPASALFAQDKGLALNSALLQQAQARGAVACLLEMGAMQGEALREKAFATGWQQVEVQQDMAGHDRLLVAH